MRTRTLLLATAAALSLTACDAAVEQLTEEAAERAAEAAGAGDTEIDIDEDGSVSVETDEGSLEVGADGSLPEGFPDDVPLPADYAVMTSSSFTNESGEAFQVSMEAPGLDVVAYVEDQVVPGLEDAGYEIVNQSTTTSDGASISNATGETSEQRVTVAVVGESDGVPFLTVTVTPLG